MKIAIIVLCCLSLVATCLPAQEPSASGAGEKMKLVYEVDFAKPQGKIRRLNGGNLGPVFSSRKKGELTSERMRELSLPLLRLHDAPYAENGAKLVDIPQIFPLFHLDPTDQRNYFFAHTDDYITSILNMGSKVLYRLGVSIEHSTRNYFTNPPADFDHWTDICIGIIRHYNEGWANGFHHNIEYWEIWNEPNLGSNMWNGTWDEYIRLYVTAAKKIKARFPTIKIGGPALAEIKGVIDYDKINAFLDACKRENAPLDFFSWHNYTTKPEIIIEAPKKMRDLLDKHGFTQTELHLNEWHYRWGTTDPWNNIEHAVFLTSVLTGWQDTPLTMGNYYTTNAMKFGIFDMVECEPNKCFYAMKAFNLFAGHENRATVTSISAIPDVRVIAGNEEKGNAACLVSCFKTPAGSIELRFSNLPGSIKNCTVRMLDGRHNLDPITDYKIEQNSVILQKPVESTVFLVVFGRE